MPEKIGRYTLHLPTAPIVIGYAAVVGKKEGEGPLAREFDHIYNDTTLGLPTWEGAESALQKDAVARALNKANITADKLSFVFAGDLLNQCLGSTQGLKELDIPFVGIYGACSTMALSLSMAALSVDGGAAQYAAALTSSHFASAERQFRFPLEYGGQRPPTSQWTVTGAGSAVVSNSGTGPHIHDILIGRIVDYGITDANNMGAAMAPAAAQTIETYLKDTATTPEDYDLILTGDLGAVGSDLLRRLLLRDGIDVSNNHNDCGLLIFDKKQKDVFAGGSGCGCSASVLCSYIFNRVKAHRLKNILFIATGALMSKISSLQGSSIPGVAHLVHICDN